MMNYDRSVCGFSKFWQLELSFKDVYRRKSGMDIRRTRLAQVSSNF